jgi:hypothetical protein
MPPLRHSFPYKPFSFAESEVVKWLLSQPECLERIFQEAYDSDQIVYEKESGLWTGMDFNIDGEVVVDE